MKCMTKPNFFALIPGLIFLFIFIFITIKYSSDHIIHDNAPIFAAFIALMFSIFTFRNNESFNKRIEIFTQGSSQPTIVHICYTLFLGAIFTTILEHTGCATAAVNLSLHIIPTKLILPGIFLSASLFSFTVGTSIGAIAAFMPVAIDIADHVGLSPSLMAATIICGSTFGDNLSILSETTIAAVKVTGVNMIQKFLTNFKIVLPAFCITFAILLYQNSLISQCVDHHHNLFDIHYTDLIKGIPYGLTFSLALTGLDILFVMLVGIMLAILIGLYFKSLTLLTAINFMFDGFYHAKDIVSLFILAVLLSGLATIITYNGGIEYLLKKLENKIHTKTQAKFAICLLIGIITITIGISPIAIIIAGPAAAKISENYDISSAETACILDIVACVLQGILPYTPQLLLAASIAQVPVFSILPYLYYQFLLIASLCGYFALHAQAISHNSCCKIKN
ncbi:MAG: Na+/H+ antiporter NhaC family protein [Candidatus Chromulinivorax sp.]